MRQQVVVVGAGMVGHRFVEELVARDREHRFDVHLVGAEEYEPYNRILLTEVLARRCDVATLTLPRPPDRAVVRRGVSATAIDRAERTVHLDDGSVLDYDHLVLATGATAFVPPIRGLADESGEAAPPRARPAHHRRLPRRRRPHGQRTARRRARRRRARSRGGVRARPSRARRHRRTPRGAPDGRTARPGSRRECWPRRSTTSGSGCTRRPRCPR